ncbi:MAG: hypothetical protein KKA81_00210 [Bacteroidetes bacterium]|nr:hypothetical protein [Bacteroidota bacterium]
MKPLFTLIFLLIFQQISFSQADETDYRKIRFSENNNLVSSGVDISPDGQFVVLSGTGDFPLIFFDWKSEQSLQTANTDSWTAGSAVHYTPEGKYIILEKLYYNPGIANYDRPSVYNLLDGESGEILKKFEGYNIVKVSSAQSMILTMEGNEITLWDLKDFKLLKTLTLEEEGFAATFSPDGKTLLIAHSPNAEELKQSGSFGKDKKSLKATSRYKNQISLYNLETLKKEGSINHFFDLVYDMSFSPDHNELFVLQISHPDINSAAKGEKQWNIKVVNAKNWEPTRKGFTSKSAHLPDYAISPDKKYFGIISAGSVNTYTSFPELHIYDYETGRFYERFTLSQRMFEKDQGEFLRTDGRAAFVFLPGNEIILITMGNRLIYWNFHQK